MRAVTAISFALCVALIGAASANAAPGKYPDFATGGGSKAAARLTVLPE